MEAFLLSQLDGCSNVEDLANATGIPEESVRAHLLRLAALGAVELEEARSSSRRVRDPVAAEPHLPPPEIQSPSPAPQVTPEDPLSDVLDRATLADIPVSDEPFASIEPDALQANSTRSSASLTSPLSLRAASLDPVALAEENDLSQDFRRRVLALFAQLDAIDHYELLGVSRSASKKEVKDAYFARVQEFHGDKFWNKNLGTYKSKIDRIFSAMTRANDTLTRKKTRQEYDIYLGHVEETLGLSSMPAGVPFVDVNGVERRGSVMSLPVMGLPVMGWELGEQSPEAAADPLAASVAIQEPGKFVPRAPKLPSTFGVAHSKVRLEPTPMIGPGGTPTHGSDRRTASPEARRQLAARKLRGTLLGDLAKQAKQAEPAQPTPPKSSPPESGNPPSADLTALRAAGKEFKARLTSFRPEAALAQRYLVMATEAESAGEWASAANALRTAAELIPDSPDIGERLERATLEVDRRYAARFKDQAAYEEREGQYDRAARSYERAARGKNSAELYQRAASCMLRVGKQDRKAVELGRQAVQLDPGNVRAHLTLARAFFSAGMTSSALAEINRALELEPKNEVARQLLKDFKKSAPNG